MKKNGVKIVARKPVMEQKSIANAVTEPVTTPLDSLSQKFAPVGAYINNFTVQALIVALLAFILNVNTFSNEYAHDDSIAIVKNEYVLEGIAGVPSLLTKDAYDSYYKQLNTGNQLSGGRYRPLSTITFAIEQQFFGAVAPGDVDSVVQQAATYSIKGAQQEKLVHDMHIRHVINVLFYLLSVVALLYFLRYIVFRNEPLVALLTAVIFTIHPIHTEVVANVKSRDEILSLLFICLTFTYAFKYDAYKKYWMLGISLLCYFLALLSKEYAISLLALIPLAFYIFNHKTLSKCLITVIPFVITAGLYVALRFYFVGTQKSEGADNDVINNPYVLAAPAEKIATEIATCLNYLKLLLFPHPLSADYSYNAIPYKDFSSPLVWLSLLVHGGMIAAMIYYFKKRSFICFAIAFYLLHLLLVSNFIFDVGATMGERMIYHSSVGFAIIAAWVICSGIARVNSGAARRTVLVGVMSVIILLCSIKTISRNKDWKNDATLSFADLKTVPNSALVNSNVAAAYINMADNETGDSAKKKYLHAAIGYLDKSVSIHRFFVAAFLNRGLAYFKMNELDSAKLDFDTVRALNPSYPALTGLYKLLCSNYSNIGLNTYAKAGKYDLAVSTFEKGIACDSLNPEIWYNLAATYYCLKQYPQAGYAWQRVLQLDPTSKEAQDGVQMVRQVMGGKK